MVLDLRRYSAYDIIVEDDKPSRASRRLSLQPSGRQLSSERTYSTRGACTTRHQTRDSSIGSKRNPENRYRDDQKVPVIRLTTPQEYHSDVRRSRSSTLPPPGAPRSSSQTTGRPHNRQTSQSISYPAAKPSPTPSPTLSPRGRTSDRPLMIEISPERSQSRHLSTQVHQDLGSSPQSGHRRKKSPAVTTGQIRSRSESVSHHRPISIVEPRGRSPPGLIFDDHSPSPSSRSSSTHSYVRERPRSYAQPFFEEQDEDDVFGDKNMLIAKPASISKGRTRIIYKVKELVDSKRPLSLAYHQLEDPNEEELVDDGIITVSNTARGRRKGRMSITSGSSSFGSSKSSKSCSRGHLPWWAEYPLRSLGMVRHS
ncbi:Serine/arginine repetitive matrix protein 1 [Agyrium rufum]|nr:Serine/arginine repetitive matrix protein 1 [Agyrium rufum]